MTYMGKVNVDGTSFPIGSTLYGTCTTPAATAAKEAIVEGFDTLQSGVTVHIKFSYANGVANPTLSIKPSVSGTATTAKPIMRYGTTAPSISARASWNAGSVVSLTYDGTYWQMDSWINDVGDTTIYSPTEPAGQSENELWMQDYE